MRSYSLERFPIHRLEELRAVNSASESAPFEAGVFFSLEATARSRQANIVRSTSGGRLPARKDPTVAAMKRLATVAQMSPNQIKDCLQRMLSTETSVDAHKASPNLARAYRFDKIVHTSGAFIDAKSLDDLRVQRNRTAEWMTRVIHSQPTTLYVVATNEKSGELRENVRWCGAPLAGFDHVIYDNAMFFEPVVESVSRARGLLPLGFQAEDGLVVEVV